MRSPLADIETSRLVLRLIGAEAITLLLDGKLTEAGVLLGAIIPEELLEKPGGLIYTQTQLNNDSTYLPWSARAIILKNEPNVIGLIRFHSSPDPVELHTWSRNAVELGYRIFSPYRRNKYAAEAVDAMIDWAELHFGINRFIASVAPGNIASNRLISSFGFARIGERVDEIDGIEYVFLKVAGK